MTSRSCVSSSWCMSRLGVTLLQSIKGMDYIVLWECSLKALRTKGTFPAPYHGTEERKAEDWYRCWAEGSWIRVFPLNTKRYSPEWCRVAPNPPSGCLGERRERVRLSVRLRCSPSADRGIFFASSGARTTTSAFPNAAMCDAPYFLPEPFAD